jgi:Ceramidase
MGKGPFGLSMGMSLDEVYSEVYGEITEFAPGKYRANRVPKPHSSFEFYALQITQIHGLSWINAIGKAIDTDTYGLEVKLAFNAMRNELATTYGKHKIFDFLKWSCSMLAGNRLKIMVTIVAVSIIAVFSMDPIAQDPAYHNFADQRRIINIPNFYNVLSNFPFIIIGIAGIRLVASGRASGGLVELQGVYLAFFSGVLLTGFGSAYYHYHPDNQTLLWDRLPMTIAFMALFSAIVGETISSRLALKLFVPLLLSGIISVIYWYVTELNGNGDLRAYALVQFLPVLLIPVILWLFNSKLNGNKYIWGILGAYALSKFMEFFDAPIYSKLGIVSGHTLKHLIAAFATLIFYWALRTRRTQPTRKAT